MKVFGLLKGLTNGPSCPCVAVCMQILHIRDHYSLLLYSTTSWASRGVYLNSTSPLISSLLYKTLHMQHGFCHPDLNVNAPLEK